MPRDVDAERALSFVDTVRNLTSRAEIQSEFLSALSSYGLDFVTCWTLQPKGRSQLEGVTLNTRPFDYVDHYVRKSYVSLDPVITHLSETTNSYTWSDVRRRKGITRKELLIIDEAREFRAHEGLVVPIMTRNGLISTVCPCGEAPNLTPRARSAIEMICIYGHQALQRINLGRESRTSTRVLTRREREVLHWVAIGKTDDEIGEILGLSAATVTKHVENAKKALNVFKRTPAVVAAIRNGEINI